MQCVSNSLSLLHVAPLRFFQGLCEMIQIHIRNISDGLLEQMSTCPGQLLLRELLKVQSTFMLADVRGYWMEGI